MAVQLEAKFPRTTKFSPSRLCRALHSMQMSYKVLQHVASERCEQEVAKHLLSVRNYPAKNLVFIDESHFDNKTKQRRRGRSKRGVPAERHSILGQDFRGSLLAAVTCNGMLLDACKLVEENVDHLVFIRWLTLYLLPNLPPNSILVLDNAAIHHHVAVKLFFKNALAGNNNLAAMMFLPPYCPILNPIERCFAQIKAFVRSYSLNNNYQLLEITILAALTTISCSNARNYFQAAGILIESYEQQQQQQQQQQQYFLQQSKEIVVLTAAFFGSQASFK